MLDLDLSNCYIGCHEYRPVQQPDSRTLSFWFYSEDLVNWMDGYSEDFHDLAVKINADTGQVIQLLGSSR
ncbi:hypothetical protein [Paenibacillus sp. OSY-SE]|uniref:hypothetical protein n=1 Tax=Paenibacillus sp. OSY-SE TaxID=1196323 RepID=UPI00036E42F1|nr:hypothetical protein [Paenibacillus sp. OSY-SE]